MPTALIVGGGPAGATAAALLAAAGRTVTLLERTAAPTDKVCGDFLSAEAVSLSRELGVDPVALGAEPVTHLRLAHGRMLAEAPLPFPALALSRRRFDSALLAVAVDRGARVLRGRAVTHLHWRRGAVVARLDGDGDGGVRADTAFIATGKHDLRDLPRPGRHAGPVGVKFSLRLHPTQHRHLMGAVELILFPGGYAGLQMIEHGQAVLCLLADRRGLPSGPRTTSDWIAWLSRHSSHAAVRLAGAEPAQVRPLAIAGLPFGYIRPAIAALPWAYALGDQIAVIPSLTGDGVALAMHSGAAAARAWLAGDSPADHTRAFGARVGRQMRLASAMHTVCLSGSWQGMVVRACRTLPGLLRLGAGWTRLTV